MLNIVGIEFTDSKPMLLCEDDNNIIGFYEVPKGVLRFKPIPLNRDVTANNSVRYSVNNYACQFTRL